MIEHDDERDDEVEGGRRCYVHVVVDACHGAAVSLDGSALTPGIAILTVTPVMGLEKTARLRAPALRELAAACLKAADELDGAGGVTVTTSP